MRNKAGVDHQFATSYGTAAQPAALNWISLTENSAAPLDTNTSLAGELNNAGGGLNRKQATYSHTTGTNTALLTTTFTKNASDGGAADTRTVAKAGLQNAPAGGTTGYETLVSPTAPLVSGDTVTPNWLFTA
ncbi:MAG: hypothetical protein AABY68_06195 [Pseudomonadota bacterium]